MNPRILILGSVLLASTAAAAFAAPEVDFDTFKSTVQHRTGAEGTVDVVSQTKIEALESGDLVSETSFFYPAAAQAISDLLSSAEGLKALAPVAREIRRIDGDDSSWSGEMDIDLGGADKDAEAQKLLWSPELFEQLRSKQEQQYTVAFRMSRTTDDDGMTTIRFILAGGKIFPKLDVTARVLAGGTAATLFSMQVRSQSTIAKDVQDRMNLAKRIIRASPQLLDGAFSRSAQE